MERLIDLKHFLVIKVEHLDQLLLDLDIILPHSSDNYMLTLILANIFAYLVIFLFVYLLLKISKKIFRRRRRLF